MDGLAEPQLKSEKEWVITSHPVLKARIILVSLHDIVLPENISIGDGSYKNEMLLFYYW